VDLVRPPGAVEICEGEPHKQVTQRGGVQDTSVIDNCEV
jgi:hypothetical protein